MGRVGAGTRMHVVSPITLRRMWCKRTLHTNEQRQRVLEDVSEASNGWHQNMSATGYR